MSLVTPLTVAEKMGTANMLRDAQRHCATLSAPELLSFLGTLDATAGTFRRDDDTFRLFRNVASIAKTELLRKAPGTYVSLSILR